jgi:putative ABC transport system permease protein
MVTLAALGLLISMAEAVRQRLYDLALMRCFGASPTRLLRQVVQEGIVISLVGGLIGIALAKLGANVAAGHLLGGQLSQGTGIDLKTTGILLAGVVALGLVGSLLPALRVYRLSLPELLAR